MKKAVIFYDDKGYSPIGSDGTAFIDLKTIQGIINRIKNNYYIKKPYNNIIILRYNQYHDYIKEMNKLNDYNILNLIKRYNLETYTINK